MKYILHNTDCIEFMRTMPANSVDYIITDPPYGVNKAVWDDKFPTEWYFYAKTISPTIVIITGSPGLKDSINLVGDEFLDIIVARNLNGMTRSKIGFSNWTAAVISGAKPKKMISNFFEFSVSGKMPNHPSPKPIQYMQKLVEKITQSGETIFDPFMGSGTTGVAALQLGRNFIGCEIDPDYFKIAEKRIYDASLQDVLI